MLAHDRARGRQRPAVRKRLGQAMSNAPLGVQGFASPAQPAPLDSPCWPQVRRFLQDTGAAYAPVAQNRTDHSVSNSKRPALASLSTPDVGSSR